MTNAEYIKLKAKIAVARELAADYPSKTIENIIQQLEAIAKHAESINNQ